MLYWGLHSQVRRNKGKGAVSPGRGKAKDVIYRLIRKHCQLLSDQVVFEEATWNGGSLDDGRLEGR